jgi:hypothetical protein
MKRVTDNDFDENGILKDGRSFRVPMFMADGTRARPLITDASGNGGFALHRPGFRVSSSDAARDAKQQAYESYTRDLENAWRAPAMHDASTETAEGQVEGAACTVRNPSYPDDQGAPGHLRRVDGKLICVPDTKQNARADGFSTDARERAYQERDAELRDAWRTAR